MTRCCCRVRGTTADYQQPWPRQKSRTLPACPGPVYPVPMPPNLSQSPAASMLPALAAGDDGLFAVWQEGPDPWERPDEDEDEDGLPPGYDVLLSRSTDGGLTWEEPLVVAANTGQWPSPRVAVAGSTIGVVWVQDVDVDEDGDEDFQIRFAPVHCD